MNESVVQARLHLADGKELRYALAPPANVVQESAPVLICLHPGWQGITPPEGYGGGFLSSIFLPAFATTGAYIAAPDCPTGAWNHPTSRDALQALVANLIENYPIDQARISFVGYSAGAWGIWYLLQDPEPIFTSAILFASLPIIEAAEGVEANYHQSLELIENRIDEWREALADRPLYLIQSRDDELFPYAGAELAYRPLQDNRSNITFVTIDGVGHFDGEGYIEPLRAAIPWLLKTWKTPAIGNL